MKKLLIISIALILITGAWYMLKPQPVPTNLTQNDSKQQTTETNQAENSNQVAYTSSGFSPSTLTVKIGSTVTFVNNSNKKMWVASNPHPIHTDFPDFDAKKGYHPGESYSFTFSESGTYKYHNHLSSFSSGVVVVK